MKTTHLLAAVLLVGQLFAADPAPTVSELETLASSGNATAQFQLGRTYFRGDGVTADKAKAHEWILKSAEQGNPDAITSMGYFYSQGVVLEKDEAKAIEWFRKGAEAGSPKSQMDLGLMLRQSKTLDRNHTESMEWLKKPLPQGMLTPFAPSASSTSSETPSSCQLRPNRFPTSQKPPKRATPPP